MKTVGQLLKNARLEKNLKLEQVEENTRIRKKFLVALEEDDWQKIPSFTYIHGFINNYAKFLNLDLSLVKAIFRRQSQQPELQRVLPQGLARPLNESFWKITPAKILFVFVTALILLFFSWLFWQYQSFVWAPRIVIDQPAENAEIKGNVVTVSGKTDPWATLLINGQAVKLIDGKFSEEIEVSPGRVTVTLEATNKFGKKQEIKRAFTVQSP